RMRSCTSRAERASSSPAPSSRSTAAARSPAGACWAEVCPEPAGACYTERSMATDPATGALLAGVRILESSLLGPGAVGMHLADLGAEVIKVENPGGDYVRRMAFPIIDGISLLHWHLNRGKRSIVLDLKTAEGVSTYLDLARHADAVIEGMRPGAL